MLGRLARKGFKKGAELANQGIEVAKDTIEDAKDNMEERRAASEQDQPVAPAAPVAPVNGSRFCPNCGNQVSGPGKFCNSCGHKLE